MEKRNGHKSLPRFRIPGIVDIRVTPPSPLSVRSAEFHDAHRELQSAKKGLEFVEITDGEEQSVEMEFEKARARFARATEALTRPRRGIEVTVFNGLIHRQLRS